MQHSCLPAPHSVREWPPSPQAAAAPGLAPDIVEILRFLAEDRARGADHVQQLQRHRERQAHDQAVQIQHGIAIGTWGVPLLLLWLSSTAVALSMSFKGESWMDVPQSPDQPASHASWFGDPQMSPEHPPNA